MHSRLAFLPLLFLLIHFQVAGDLFRKHYEAAEAHRRAGNLVAAEAEYTEILKLAYPALGRIYLAQGNYPGAVAALEAAATTELYKVGKAGQSDVFQANLEKTSLDEQLRGRLAVRGGL